MVKINRTFINLLLLAFAIWLLPFLLRLFWIEMPQINTLQIEQLHNKINDPMQETAQLLSERNNNEAFIFIAKNNLKGCAYNITGGVLLGLGTLINLLYNGFFSADIIMSYYKSGINISDIIRFILPHSFELFGFWLSGGIGFYIAWQIVNFIRGKENFTFIVYKQIGCYLAITILITLLAAYVEAFITSSLL